MEKRTPEQLAEALEAFEAWRGKVRECKTPFYHWGIPATPGGVVIPYDTHKYYENFALPESSNWREFRSQTLIHSAVLQAMRSHIPSDPIKLLQEYPATSTTDLTRLAYTREQSHWVKDPPRRTVTSIGKYLTRHFPTLPPHEVRDITVLFTGGEQCKIVWTMEEMLWYLKRGPKSCMTGEFSNLPAHPYEVYAPEYGWGLCVRTEGGEVMGRALVNTTLNVFVRSYKTGPSYSYSDEAIDAYLKSLGYDKKVQWPDGLKLRLIKHNDRFVAPYIDGGQQRVVWRHAGLSIDEDGGYDCSSQNGTPEQSDEDEDDDDYFTCEHCDDRFHMDEAQTVYRPRQSAYYIAMSVCEGCHDRDFVELPSGHMVHEDNAVRLHDDTYIDSRFSYAQLRNGDYAKSEDVIELLDGTFVLSDNDELIGLANGQCVLAGWDGLWKCEESGAWYVREDDPPVTLDGETYHADSETVTKMREAQLALALEPAQQA